ncbi:MAG: cobalamin-binding protein [Candidatus Dadabacteria bacterium]|jgi:iron complex transport system substrate-binding protein
MRICSFLPSTTEIVYELGLGDSLGGITHECNYPPEVKEKKVVIMSFLDHKKLSSKEIDDLVTKNAIEGKSTYLVDKDALKEANPDIILTQKLCEVCAVSGNQVMEAVQVLGHTPEIISLEPTTIYEIFDTIITIGEATGTKEKAIEITDKLKARVERVRSQLENERDRPRVFCLEWLDPPFVGGHWVPEMVEIAGGENGLGKAGEPSFKATWEEIAEFAPQMLFIMPCGFDIDKTIDELDAATSKDEWFSLPATNKGEIYIVDANSYFSRPGPRIVDGLEILAKAIHPEVIKNYSPPPESIINLRNYMQLQLFSG